MAFICPKCKASTLEINSSIQLGADRYNDEYSLQALKCSECDYVCVAEYCESRRGRGDSWSHFAHAISNEEYEKLKALVDSCPDNKNSKCSCKAHTHYQFLEDENLKPLSKIEHDEKFFKLMVAVKSELETPKFLRHWMLRFLLVLGVVVLVWAWWRPAQRFDFREAGPNEFRLMTWNVGYFAPSSDKNARDVDIERISALLEDASADVTIVQELGSLEQADRVARLLGQGWRVHSVETGHGAQVLAVYSRLPVNVVDTQESGGRKLIGISLIDEHKRDFYIVAVHSPHPARGMQNTVDSIRGAISMLEDKDEAVRIIAGDLNYNFDPDGDGFGDAALYEEITASVSDGTAALGETYMGHTRIDHIFHFPKGLRIVPEASGMIDLSTRFAKVPGFRDHRPIVMTYDLESIF